jgi:GH15 family glucan-1,4-alpha-glucosidase
LPESIGGGRNWDYRYSWVRDSSFTVYVFLKLGYTEEAEAYMNFIFERITHWQQRNAKGPVEHLPLMFRIDGSHILDEVPLEHFGGYKDSTPVRIGNGASTQ